MSEYIDLDEIERRAETRCAGKWEQYDYHGIVVSGVGGSTDLLHTGATFSDDLDCALAVKAVNATPAFIKAVRALQEFQLKQRPDGKWLCIGCDSPWGSHEADCWLADALTPFSKGGPE